MPFQLDLVHVLSFVVGLVIGFVAGYLVGRKRPRGANTTITSVTCNPPPMPGAIASVTVDEIDPGHTLMDLWSYVYAVAPNPVPGSPPGGSKQTNVPLTIGPASYTGGVQVVEKSGYLVVWAHLQPPATVKPYYIPSKPVAFNCP
jgi:hypothetical protein